MKWLMALAIAGTCSFAQPAEVRRWADHWAGEYGVERELVYAVIEAESGGDARDIECRAVGVMQLCGTASCPKPIRREDNVRAGVAYLAARDLCGGDRRLITASYIAGQNRVLQQAQLRGERRSTTSRASHAVSSKPLGDVATRRNGTR
jgi:soluble lytic murein transglycosylase-like protein